MTNKPIEPVSTRKKKSVKKDLYANKTKQIREPQVPIVVPKKTKSL